MAYAVEILIAILSLFFSGIIAWAITHGYYMKSLKNQEEAASKEINELKSLFNPKEAQSKNALKLSYIDKGIEEYKRAGTPVRYIDTLEIPVSEKAEIYDVVMLRVKGRLGKSNKYRQMEGS